MCVCGVMYMQHMNKGNARGAIMFRINVPPSHSLPPSPSASIVALLLEHKASTIIQNQRMETASQCAQSRKVSM